MVRWFWKLELSKDMPIHCPCSYAHCNRGGVATLGLALALTQRIYQGYSTIEEDELLVKLDRIDERASLSPLETKKENTQRKRDLPEKANTPSATVAQK